MTPKELFLKIERQKQERAALAKLWESLFPGCPVPGERQFTIWLNRYDFETVVAGLEKALQQEQRREQRYDEDRRKCLAGTAWDTGPYIPTAAEPMTCGEIVKYASGVMQGIKTGRFEDE
jgi:hypothetical protein